MNVTPEYDSKNILENAPEMWLKEIRYIERAFVDLAQKNKSLNILEWGSGNGTIYFSKFLKQKKVSFKWIAIEHFIPWYKKVVSMIKENDLSGDVECYLKSPTDEPDKNIQETFDLYDYLNFPLTLGIKFDFVFVDGRKRTECLKKASKLLDPEGVLFLHDAEREWYHSGLKYYDGCFVTEQSTSAAWNGIQKLWMGKLKGAYVRK